MIGGLLILGLGALFVFLAAWMSHPDTPKAAIWSTVAIVILALTGWLLWLGSHVHP